MLSLFLWVFFFIHFPKFWQSSAVSSFLYRKPLPLSSISSDPLDPPPLPPKRRKVRLKFRLKDRRQSEINVYSVKSVPRSPKQRKRAISARRTESRYAMPARAYELFKVASPALAEEFKWTVTPCTHVNSSSLANEVEYSLLCVLC